jgi:opacity protein-like surface antigen
MTKFALFGAALLATALASPALAQAVVENPGYCAQFYPNANCQNYGPGNPRYSGYGWSNGYARMRGPHHRHHHYR